MNTLVTEPISENRSGIGPPGVPFLQAAVGNKTAALRFDNANHYSDPLVDRRPRDQPESCAISASEGTGVFGFGLCRCKTAE